MDLTTSARVKERLAISGATFDSLLATLIARTSAEAERIMNRDAEATARTREFDVVVGMATLSLSAYPIGTLTSVKNTARPGGSTETLTADVDFYADDDSGTLHFYRHLISGPGALEVVWTGGMGASTAAFIAAYPDVADAVDERVAQLWQRRDDIGLVSLTHAQGSVGIAEGWTDGAMEVLERHRRWGRSP